MRVSSTRLLRRARRSPHGLERTVNFRCARADQPADEERKPLLVELMDWFNVNVLSPTRITPWPLPIRLMSDSFTYE